MLGLRSIPFQNVGAIPGQISAQVPSSITIYGISLIVKRELGPCTLNIRIYQRNETGEKEEMAANIKLMDMGFLGTLPPNEPEHLTLFYDYDYPLLDCPLLMANFSIQKYFTQSTKKCTKTLQRDQQSGEKVTSLSG